MDFLGFHNLNRILNTSLYVLDLEIRIVIANDCVERKPFANEFQNGLYRNSGAGNAGFPEMNFGAYPNSIHK